MKTIRDYINLIEANDFYLPREVEKEINTIDIEKLAKQKDARIDNDNSGWYMYAKQKDPHTVRLHSHELIDLRADGKYTYIKAIKNLIGENPYVPTIDEIKIIKVKDPQIKGVKITYEIRNLFHWNQIPPIQLYIACKRILDSCDLDFDKDLLLRLRRTNRELYRVRDIDKNTLLDLNYLITETCDVIPQIASGDIQSTDLNLTSLCSIINSLTTPTKEWDLHKNNVMFRLGSYGAQLVITDPIA